MLVVVVGFSTSPRQENLVYKNICVLMRKFMKKNDGGDDDNEGERREGGCGG